MSKQSTMRVKASQHKKHISHRKVEKVVTSKTPTNMQVFRTPEGDVLTVNVPLVRTHLVAKIMEVLQ